MVHASLRQRKSAPPGGVQVWEFTLPAADVPTGGITGWAIEVRFAAKPGQAAVHTVAATVTEAGDPDGPTDAVFEITLDTADLSGFGVNSHWAWAAWRTDGAEDEMLAGRHLDGIETVGP